VKINKELAAIRNALGHAGTKARDVIYLDTKDVLKFTDLNTVMGHTDNGIMYGLVIEISGWECLAGSTLIDTPRDVEKHPWGIPIKDLVGKKPWVYGFDQSLGRIVLRQASRVWKVGKRPVWKVNFHVSKNSVRIYGKQPEYILATAEHLIMLREASGNRSKFSPAYDYRSLGYCQLKDLEKNERIMPFFRKRTNGHCVLNLNDGTKVSEHRFILSEIYGERDGSWDGHHKDETPMNNSVENLEWMTDSNHMSYHLSKMNLEAKAGWQKYGNHPRGMLGKKHSKKTRARISATLQKRAAGNLNHRIKSIEFHGYEDVYDMEVPGINNFVANGVVVHNSNGKSSVIMALAALAQHDGAHVIWGDLENSFKSDYARLRGFIKCPKCLAKQPDMLTCTTCDGDGLDWDKLTLIQPYVGKFGTEKEPRLASAQELCTEIEAAMKFDRKDCDRLFVVMDSVSALETDEEQKAGLKGGNMKTGFSLPKFMGRLLRRWMGIALTRHAIIILVNQLRQGPAKFGDGSYTTGGNAIRFYPHVRLRAKRVLGSKIVEKGHVVGIKGILENKKNKAGGEEGAKVGFKIWFKKNIEFLPAKDVMQKDEE